MQSALMKSNSKSKSIKRLYLHAEFLIDAEKNSSIHVRVAKGHATMEVLLTQSRRAQSMNQPTINVINPIQYN